MQFVGYSTPTPTPTHTHTQHLASNSRQIIPNTTHNSGYSTTWHGEEAKSLCPSTRVVVLQNYEKYKESCTEDD
jgi:hypothetical protein